MEPTTRSSVNTPEANSRNATAKSSAARATRVTAESSRSAGCRRCRGYRVMKADPTPNSDSCTPSMMAEMAPAVRPTCAAGNRLAASSQNRKPRLIRAPLPEMRPSELQIIGCERATWRAHRSPDGLEALATLDDGRDALVGMGARNGLPQRRQHPHIVVDGVEGVVRDPPWPGTNQAQDDAPEPGGERKSEQPAAAPAVFGHHPAQPVAVGQELPARERK